MSAAVKEYVDSLLIIKLWLSQFSSFWGDFFQVLEKVVQIFQKNCSTSLALWVCFPNTADLRNGSLQTVKIVQYKTQNNNLANAG